MSDPDYRYNPTRENPALNLGFTVGAVLLVMVIFAGNCTCRISVDSRPTNTAPVASTAAIGSTS